MFKHISLYAADPKSQILEQQQSKKNVPYGLNKIVAVGYDKNKSQCLPSSRYSLKINVVGLGTAGAVSGIGLAALGHKVIAVDHDQRKVNALNQGRFSCVDSQLKALLEQVRRLNNLVASCDLHNAILSTDITMICIGSSNIQKTTADSDNMTSIVKQISATLQSKRNFHLIVICQPTTEADIQNFIGSDIEHSTGKTLGKDFGLCFIPLVLSENQALSDFYALPNMTITASDKRSESLVGKLFNGYNHKIKYVRYLKM
jgi:GDP-mannose 6-dehydrogenase